MNVTLEDVKNGLGKPVGLYPLPLVSAIKSFVAVDSGVKIN